MTATYNPIFYCYRCTIIPRYDLQDSITKKIYKCKLITEPSGTQSFQSVDKNGKLCPELNYPLYWKVST